VRTTLMVRKVGKGQPCVTLGKLVANERVEYVIFTIAGPVFKLP
jgi:hypothetical protein